MPSATAPKTSVVSSINARPKSLVGETSVLRACPMKLGREVSRHNELYNWRNTHSFELVMATKWLLLTISETEPGLWDRLLKPWYSCCQAPSLLESSRIPSLLIVPRTSLTMDVGARKTTVASISPRELYRSGRQVSRRGFRSGSSRALLTSQYSMALDPGGTRPSRSDWALFADGGVAVAPAWGVGEGVRGWRWDSTSAWEHAWVWAMWWELAQEWVRAPEKG